MQLTERQKKIEEYKVKATHYAKLGLNWAGLIDYNPQDEEEKEEESERDPNEIYFSDDYESADEDAPQNTNQDGDLDGIQKLEGVSPIEKVERLDVDDAQERMSYSGSQMLSDDIDRQVDGDLADAT